MSGIAMSWPAIPRVGARRLGAVRTWVRICVVALAVLLPARGHAHPGQPAQPAPPELLTQPASALDDPRPWAVGVSEERQTLALELYVAGNVEFRESRYAQALAKYREAIQHWDHPAIRFNIAVCLINLDQPLEAKENLDRSLAYGDGPLGAEMLAQGITYRKLLDAQLARMRILCQQHGAEVTVDGKLLFTGPGTADVYLLPGEHQVVVSKDGFLTSSKTVAIVPGKPLTYDVRHLERRVSIRMARRWAAWKPWAMLTGGVAAANAGILTYVISTNTAARYEDGIARCSGPCDANTLEVLEGVKSSRDRQRVVATVLLSVGAVAVATGAIGAVMNQPRLRVEPARVPSVAYVPGGAVVTMSWGF